MQVASSGSAPDYQWERMGLFHLTGDTTADSRYPVYKQDDHWATGQTNFIWYSTDFNGSWYIGNMVRSSIAQQSLNPVFDMSVLCY